jgi:hypothetical protein
MTRKTNGAVAVMVLLAIIAWITHGAVTVTSAVRRAAVNAVAVTESDAAGAAVIDVDIWVGGWTAIVEVGSSAYHVTGRYCSLFWGVPAPVPWRGITVERIVAD